MSLITAKIIGEHIYCVGDTKITYVNQINSNPILNGCIKQYVFNNMLVCFAGCTTSFEKDIEEYRSCTNLEEIKEVAIKKAVEYEILAASQKPSRIIIIKNKVALEVNAGFIGDSNAFDKYQSYYHNPRAYPLPQNTGQIRVFKIPEPVIGAEDYLRMYKAMKDVATDTNIESVGGIVITVATHEEKFQYMTYCDIYTTDVVIPEPGEARTIGFGTRENGGCAVQFDSYNENSKTTPTYYFLHGGFGVIFPEATNSLSKAEFIKAENPCQWALAIKERLGKPLTSNYLSLYHCIIEGEKYIAIKDYTKALDCYKLRLSLVQDTENIEPNTDRFLAGYFVSLFNNGYYTQALSEITKTTKEHPDFKMCTHYRDLMERAATQRAV